MPQIAILASLHKEKKKGRENRERERREGKERRKEGRKLELES